MRARAFPGQSLRQLVDGEGGGSTVGGEEVECIAGGGSQQRDWRVLGPGGHPGGCAFIRHSSHQPAPADCHPHRLVGDQVGSGQLYLARVQHLRAAGVGVAFLDGHKFIAHDAADFFRAAQ